MRRVLLEKSTKKGDRPIAAGGSVYEGWEDVQPSVGEPYCIYCETGGILRTSDVVQIEDGYITTKNSLYKLTILEEEPFELSGESYPQITQKLFGTKARLEKSS